MKESSLFTRYSNIEVFPAAFKALALRCIIWNYTHVLCKKILLQQVTHSKWYRCVVDVVFGVDDNVYNSIWRNFVYKKFSGVYRP